MSANRIVTAVSPVISTVSEKFSAIHIDMSPYSAVDVVCWSIALEPGVYSGVTPQFEHVEPAMPSVVEPVSTTTENCCVPTVSPAVYTRPPSSLVNAKPLDVSAASAGCVPPSGASPPSIGPPHPSTITATIGSLDMYRPD